MRQITFGPTHTNYFDLDEDVQAADNVDGARTENSERNLRRVSIGGIQSASQSAAATRNADSSPRNTAP